MRHLISVSILALSLVLTTAVHAEEWFRMNMDAPIYFGSGAGDDGEGPPDHGGNTTIEIVAAATSAGRVLDDIRIDVTVNGIDETYSVEVLDLPGTASFEGSYIEWTSAAVGTYTPRIEVRDEDQNLVASRALQLVVYPQLTASVPQTIYEVAIGDELTIQPTVGNAIGAIEWGSTPSSLPSWLAFDESTGALEVGTTASQNLSNISLTAVDQADMASASTSAFSVAVLGSCEIWTAVSGPESSGWFSVIYANGKFVAVGATGTNRVMTSPDGVTWTAQTAAQANTWRSVTYGSGKFVAISSDGTNRVMTSTDGVTWTAQTAAQANSWYSITYGNGLFVAVSYDGTNRVMTSPDGVTWTVRTTPVKTWYGVAFAQNQFVAVAGGGADRVMTSPDAVTWTLRAAGEDVGNWYSVGHGNGRYVSVSSGKVMSSPDGTNWAIRPVPAGTFRSVAYGNGRFVAVSSNGANPVITSDCD